MIGSSQNPGIIFRTVMDLYARIDTLSTESDCEVIISYLEIYNETVIDLINPGTQLQIREDGKSGVNIPGLSRHRPSGPEDLIRLLQYGNANRTQHPTDANKESSRSHAVFQVCLFVCLFVCLSQVTVLPYI
jgi:kinesin family protein 18/19